MRRAPRKTLSLFQYLTPPPKSGQQTPSSANAKVEGIPVYSGACLRPRVSSSGQTIFRNVEVSYDQNEVATGSMGRSDTFSVKVFAMTAALALVLGWPSEAAAYAVLAHEAIIDSAWDTNIRPLLLMRFPDATGEQLKEAHGYAYGGAIIQDMGYYPHGNFFFSDLTHYVRSGDFIQALIRDSKDLNDYAFALGALAHYAADNDGHPIGTNRAVPILYPKLKKKYGDSVTYEQDRLAHVKTEFGFDVLEIAHGRYAPDSYHDFIGFGVSAPLLEQAFP